MASLKGPKHGGANIKVTRMFEDMKAHLTDWTDDDQIRAYLEALLEKRAFDNKGLIYEWAMRFIRSPTRVPISSRNL